MLGEHTVTPLSSCLSCSDYVCVYETDGGECVKHWECVKLCTPLFETVVSSYVSSSSGMEAAE